MKFLIATLFVVTSISNLHAGTAMKLEGNCSGTLKNNAPVNFSYYSDFDGCKTKSNGAVSFSGENDMGLRTGNRALNESQDLYDFDDIRIALANSTGNTSASLTYTDEEGKTQKVEVQCEVRDYEYVEC